jgi:Na+/H+ antiporter
VNGIEALAILAGALAVVAVSRKLGWPAPLVLVAVGLVVSFIPGMPDFRIDPQLVLVLFLPPLLYSAALDSSYLSFRANLRPITLLSVGLVVATVVGVGYVAYWLVPGLPLASAFVVGAVIAPPDAVAAVAIGRRLGLPRRLMTLLSGESLANDATALTLFKVTVGAALGSTTSLAGGAGVFALAVFGGVAVGLVLAFLVHQIRIRIGDGVLESALGLLVPFAAYLAADAVQGSGVLAVVTAGLYLGHNAPRAGYTTRLQETALWRAVDVLLESMVFALIGLNFRFALSEAQRTGHSPLSLLGPVLAVLAATMLLRIVWMYPATYLPRRIPCIRRRDPPPPWRHVTVVAWAGMRGVVSLAAAAAVPESMPGRDLVLLLAFTVTVGTLLVQGTTLPLLIRALDVRGTEEHHDALAEARAARSAASAATDRLDELVDDEDTDAPEHVVDRLRTLTERRGQAAWERLGQQETENATSSYRRLRLEMLEAERKVYVAARDSGEIDDEVLDRVLTELDLEEARLSARD